MINNNNNYISFQVYNEISSIINSLHRISAENVGNPNAAASQNAVLDAEQEVKPASYRCDSNGKSNSSSSSSTDEKANTEECRLHER